MLAGFAGNTARCCAPDLRAAAISFSRRQAAAATRRAATRVQQSPRKRYTESWAARPSLRKVAQPVVDERQATVHFQGKLVISARWYHFRFRRWLGHGSANGPAPDQNTTDERRGVQKIP